MPSDAFMILMARAPAEPDEQTMREWVSSYKDAHPKPAGTEALKAWSRSYLSAQQHFKTYVWPSYWARKVCEIAEGQEAALGRKI